MIICLKTFVRMILAVTIGLVALAAITIAMGLCAQLLEAFQEFSALEELFYYCFSAVISTYGFVFVFTGAFLAHGRQRFTTSCVLVIVGAAIYVALIRFISFSDEDGFRVGQFAVMVGGGVIAAALHWWLERRSLGQQSASPNGGSAARQQTETTDGPPSER